MTHPPPTQPALRLGLTGGIGSGKSTVAKRLAEHGALIVDTDAIARALTAPGGAAIAAVRAAFGPQSIGADGAMDRAAMRERVFGDPAAKAQLEGILHPMIVAHALREAAGAAPGQAIVFDVPLLVETAHWIERVMQVWVVDCDEPVQIERVMARSGWPREAAQAAMAAQATRAQRLAVADVVLDNSGTLPELIAQVDAAWARATGTPIKAL